MDGQLPKMRVIQGTAREVDEMLPGLVEDYTVVSVNFAVVKDEVAVTMLLVSKSEMRQSQLMAASPMINMRGH